MSSTRRTGCARCPARSRSRRISSTSWRTAWPRAGGAISWRRGGGGARGGEPVNDRPHERTSDRASVYQPALDRLRGRLADHSFEEIIRRSGANRLDGSRIGLRSVGRDYANGYPDGIGLDADGATAEIGTAILLLLYLLESTGRDLEGEWVSFEQLPGGAGYMGSFRGRVMGPVLRTFGSNPEALLAAGAALGGEGLSLGDPAVRLPALPRV